MTLSEYESGTYAAGALRFDKIVRFATIDCVKAGWLLKRKGVWSLTDTGREAFTAYQAPGDFYRRAVELYREWKATQETDDDDQADDESTEEIEASITYEQAEATCNGGKGLVPKMWAGKFPYQVKVKLVLPKVTEVPKNLLTTLGLNPAVGRCDNCVDEDLSEELIHGMLALGQ